MKAVLSIAVSICLLGCLPARAQENIAGACPEATTEQLEIAADIEQRFGELEDGFFKTVAEFNGKDERITKEFDFPDAWYGVTVARGDVVEKAGFLANVRRDKAPPFIPKPCFHRYIDVNVHPATPHVGFLHATLHFALNESGGSQIGGTMLLVPAVRHDDDTEQLREGIDRVFAERGGDVERYRLGICSGYRKSDLRTACAGVSFYRPPPLEVNAANVDLVVAAYEAMVDGYFDLLAERMDQPFDAAQLAERQDMRKRWFNDQLLNDRFVVELIPFEVWTLANQAPTVDF